MEEIGKITKTYTTRSVEKKLMGDAMKENKLTTVKRRRLKKGTVIEEENIKVDDIERVMNKLTLILLLQ